MSLSLVPAQAGYIGLDRVSGSNDLSLFLDDNDFDLDLNQDDTLQIKLNASGLYESNRRFDSIQFRVYEISNGQRLFEAKQNEILTRKQGSRNNIFYLSAGDFSSSSKDIEIEVLDSLGNVEATFSAELTASNIPTRAPYAGTETYACASSDSDDCLVEKIFDRLSIEAAPERRWTTRMSRNDNLMAVIYISQKVAVVRLSHLVLRAMLVLMVQKMSIRSNLTLSL